MGSACRLCNFLVEIPNGVSENVFPFVVDASDDDLGLPVLWADGMQMPQQTAGDEADA
jgi:hypothetical protein